MTQVSSEQVKASASADIRERPLRAAIWGASGAAGAEVLRQCLAEPRIGDIVAFTRRPLSIDGNARGRVGEVPVADFLDFTPYRRELRDIDVAYWCLGVSQLTEPRREPYRVITRDFAVAGASVLRDESPQAMFHFLSGMGASRLGLSPVMWGRVKGEAERAILNLKLRRTALWRPTFIHSVAGRERPTRGDIMAERFCFRFIPLLTNSTLNIAHAMLHTTFDEQGDRTYYPWQIDRLARHYRASIKQPKQLR
jgi:hypothetical protein